MHVNQAIINDHSGNQYSNNTNNSNSNNSNNNNYSYQNQSNDHHQKYGSHSNYHMAFPAKKTLQGQDLIDNIISYDYNMDIFNWSRQAFNIVCQNIYSYLIASILFLAISMAVVTLFLVIFLIMVWVFAIDNVLESFDDSQQEECCDFSGKNTFSLLLFTFITIGGYMTFAFIPLWEGYILATIKAFKGLKLRPHDFLAGYKQHLLFACCLKTIILLPIFFIPYYVGPSLVTCLAIFMIFVVPLSTEHPELSYKDCFILSFRIVFKSLLRWIFICALIASFITGLFLLGYLYDIILGLILWTFSLPLLSFIGVGYCNIFGVDNTVNVNNTAPPLITDSV